MHTDGRRYLVEGDFAAKTVRTLREWVECPSLSPDGTRIAFKEAVDGNPRKGWRLSVLDLATMRVTHTREARSVDDQAAWLDNDTILYQTLEGSRHRALVGSVTDGTARDLGLTADDWIAMVVSPDTTTAIITLPAAGAPNLDIRSVDLGTGSATRTELGAADASWQRLAKP